MPVIQCHIPTDLNPRQHCSENIGPCVLLLFFTSSVLGNIFPVPGLVTLLWPPARASFLSFPSPIPLLLRGFLVGTQVVVCYYDPALTWEMSKLCLGCASKFRLARQPGLESLPWCRGPVLAAFFGFQSPGTRKVLWFGTYGPIIIILLVTCGALCGELFYVRCICRNYVVFYNICSFIL
jgi:hypothetical protein